MQGMWVRSLGCENLLEGAWQPTVVFLPVESHGERSHGLQSIGSQSWTGPKWLSTHSTHILLHPISTKPMFFSSTHYSPFQTFTIPHWLLTLKKIFRQFYSLLPLDSQASQQPCPVSISPSESWITSLTAKHLTSPRRPFQNWPELQISSFHSSNTPISSL